jgi:hypothetical protein
LRYWGRAAVIFSADHNILIDDVPPQNLEAMFEAAVEFRKY